MKPLTRFAVAVLVLVGTATFAAAQAPSGVLLNKLEVQKLVAEETPIGSLTLAAHFNALADDYLAEARSHRAMGAAYKANANRSAATTAGSHCERLAALATESATAARELAKYHTDLADGKAVVVPKGAAALHAGQGAPEPTADQLHKLAKTARTRTDHLALAEYFDTVAKKNATAAEDHVAMASAYRAGVRKGIYDPAVNCDRLARIAREAAKEATNAANLHKQLANVG